MTTINYNGKILTLDCDAQLGNYQDGVAFFAKAHDESGSEYEVRWDYVKPDWYVSEDETPTNGDCSGFADWIHPAYAREL